ncbi:MULTISPECIES: tetratricopeptide repeat protein [Giesbergeria]|uniref:Tetratricopeptide repeat protein n=1 Tax=Giesbergeria sinuosa TaxID=80883 RepID=A0ABV9Q973_9BURK
MARWTLFPYPHRYQYDSAGLAAQWLNLHRGDAEPLPSDAPVLAAWVLFHNGHFQQAMEAGLAAGTFAGITVANLSTIIHARYLEKRERTRQELFLEVAERAQIQIQSQPDNPNAWYCHGYALQHYSQGISVAKALAQGVGNKVKHSLERAIALAPAHADARMVLGVFHAEVIDKVGPLIGGMTYGAKKDVALRLFQETLQLQPESALARTEYADALIMLEGSARMAEATALYEQAARSTPLDAAQYLATEMAQTELATEEYGDWVAMASKS